MQASGLTGGRVPKDSRQDLARAEAEAGSELDERLIRLARGLYLLMAEVATSSANRSKLFAGASLVTQDVVDALERGIDDLLSAMAGWQEGSEHMPSRDLTDSATLLRRGLGLGGGFASADRDRSLRRYDRKGGSSPSDGSDAAAWSRVPVAATGHPGLSVSA